MTRFHDAELLELAFPEKGKGLMRIRFWNTTPDRDANGYYIQNKHALISLRLEGVSVIDCADFDMVPAIIFSLDIVRIGDEFSVDWNSSYGLEGSITAKTIRIDLEPSPDL